MKSGGDHGCLRCGNEVTSQDVVFIPVRICDACVTQQDLRERLDVTLAWVAFYRRKLQETEETVDDLVEVQRLGDFT